MAVAFLSHSSFCKEVPAIDRFLSYHAVRPLCQERGHILLCRPLAFAMNEARIESAICSRRGLPAEKSSLGNDRLGLSQRRCMAKESEICFEDAAARAFEPKIILKAKTTTAVDVNPIKRAR